MAALTVLCHPPVRPEPFGLVVIEAMAVAAPRRSGAPEAGRDRAGRGHRLLVPVGDADAFADSAVPSDRGKPGTSRPNERCPPAIGWFVSTQRAFCQASRGSVFPCNSPVNGRMHRDGSALRGELTRYLLLYRKRIRLTFMA